VPREKALAVESPATQHLRLVVRPLRVADVAIFYGERSGGIRTYLDAKTRYAAESRAFEHHLVIPGRSSATVARPGGWTHTVRSLNVNRANGYRLPLDGNVVTEVLRTVSPDVVLLHDPFWRPRRLCRLVKDSDGVAVMVHHSSAALGAHAWPGPAGVYARAIRVWFRHAYKRADVVMSACDPFHDTRRPAAMPLRLGLHPAFVPRPDVDRSGHVLYVGRLVREKGIFALLRAAAVSPARWRLRMIGSGPAEALVRSRARRLGIAERLEIRPFIASPEALAREYAAASCVLMPGPFETFGLAALEAAACATPVATCETTPSVPAIGRGAITFAPGDTAGLLCAIEAARATAPDPAAAQELASRNSWETALSAELDALKEIARW
jgi:alpha-1,6-mannosyltransferase